MEVTPADGQGTYDDPERDALMERYKDAIVPAQETPRQWADRLTANDCVTMIEGALAARDFKAVVAALDLLRTKDAERAADVLAVIKAGMNESVRRAAAEVDGASADLIERAREAVRGI